MNIRTLIASGAIVAAIVGLTGCSDDAPKLGCDNPFGTLLLEQPEHEVVQSIDRTAPFDITGNVHCVGQGEFSTWMIYEVDSSFSGKETPSYYLAGHIRRQGPDSSYLVRVNKLLDDIQTVDFPTSTVSVFAVRADASASTRLIETSPFASIKGWGDGDPMQGLTEVEGTRRVLVQP